MLGGVSGWPVLRRLLPFSLEPQVWLAEAVRASDSQHDQLRQCSWLSLGRVKPVDLVLDLVSPCRQERLLSFASPECRMPVRQTEERATERPHGAREFSGR